MRLALPADTPAHVALAYDAWAPVGDDGKVADTRRTDWLSRVAGIGIADDYSRSFDRWKKSFSAAGDRLAELTLASRLLIGHGNDSPSELGITVHHTWGVPIIPGSAVKGLVAHYVDATYGPGDPARKPWEQEGEERARAEFQGVTWHERRIARGPGAVYRALFGAPDAREDDTMRTQGFAAGASAGLVTFHDALYVPHSVSDDRPFAADVLTVHQMDYYSSAGASAPNDYDRPNPVAFVTVRPGARLLFALSGPADWTELAERLLRDALEHWGVGGKTSAGYGRFVAPDASRSIAGVGRAGSGTNVVSAAPVRPGSRVDVVLLEERTKKGGWKARHDGASLEGPIQNSNDVPGDRKPGDFVSVEVKIAKGKESGFRYLSATDSGTTKARK